jgi:uncharacterized protein (DUF2062 family)
MKTPPREGPLRRWVVRPVLQQLTQGVTPAKLAAAIAWGFTLGLFPILGSNTLLSLIIGVPLRLNQPALQAFKTLAYPLQWSLLVGFYRAGEWLFDRPHVSIHVPTLIERFFDDPGSFFRDYGLTALGGIAVWVLVAPVLLSLLYATALPLVTRLDRLRRRDRVQPAAT